MEAASPERFGDRIRNVAILIGSIAIATLLAVAAQETDHPVTAANVFIVAVLFNGTFAGLRQGLSAAIIASLIYGFFIRLPVYALRFDDVDDLLPILALTTTAILSGVLSGELRGRVASTERARLRLGQLLDYSRRLHSAVSLEEIAQQLTLALTDERSLARCLALLKIQHDFREPERWMQAVASTGREQTEIDARPLPLDAELEDERAVVSLTIMAIERIELLEETAAAETAIRSDKLKSALISSLSHDLRTPLAAITTAASNLEHFGTSMDDAERTRMVATIQEQCSRLLDFTGKAMSLGRIEGGLTSDDMDVVDLEDAIDGALAAVRPLSVGRRIIRRIDSAGVFTHANPFLLEHALANVIENALRYAPTESSITVSLNRVGAYADVGVADDGPGIAASDVPRVFDRFFRGGNAAGSPGHGLGLSIVKAFTDAMGGEIKLISPTLPTGGTEVRIILPALDLVHVSEKTEHV